MIHLGEEEGGPMEHLSGFGHNTCVRGVGQKKIERNYLAISMIYKIGNALNFILNSAVLIFSNQYKLH